VARLGTEVECLAVDSRGTGALSEGDVCVDHVAHIHVVADASPVASQDGPFAAEQASNGPWNDAAPVQIAAAVNVAASRDRRRQPVGVRVRCCEEVGAALGDIVGMSSVERHASVSGRTGDSP
jgi:hypothetical protein